MARHYLERVRPTRPALSLPPLACGILLTIVVSGCGTSTQAGSQPGNPTVTPTPLPTSTPSPNPAWMGVASRVIAARNAAGHGGSSVAAGVAALDEQLPQSAHADFKDALTQIHIAQRLLPSGDTGLYGRIESLLNRSLRSYLKAANEYRGHQQAAQNDANSGDATLAAVDDTLSTLPETRSGSVKLEAANLVLSAEKGAVGPDGAIGSNRRREIALASTGSDTHSATTNSGGSHVSNPQPAPTAPTLALAVAFPTPQSHRSASASHSSSHRQSRRVQARVPSASQRVPHHRTGAHRSSATTPQLAIPSLSVPSLPSAPSQSTRNPIPVGHPAFNPASGAAQADLQTAAVHLKSALQTLGRLGTQGNEVTNAGIDDDTSTAQSALAAASEKRASAQHGSMCGRATAGLQSAIDAYSAALNALQAANAASQSNDTAGYAQSMATALDRITAGGQLAAKVPAGC